MFITFYLFYCLESEFIFQTYRRFSECKQGCVCMQCTLLLWQLYKPFILTLPDICLSIFISLIQVANRDPSITDKSCQLCWSRVQSEKLVPGGSERVLGDARAQTKGLIRSLGESPWSRQGETDC